MAFNPPIVNLAIVLPVIIVAGWGVLLMVLDMLIKREDQSWAAWFSLLGLGLAAAQVIGIAFTGYTGGTFIPESGLPMVVHDGYVTFMNSLFLVTGGLSILISVQYLKKQQAITEHVEFYMLLLFSISGMMLMGMANDLILIFLGLELLSIPLYIMCGIARPRAISEESAVKYFLLGAFSSGFLVFGIALLYGATGSTALPIVSENFASGGTLSLMGLALTLVGFAFKVGAVPFHMWTPDVYEGAPTAVTAFMSVGAKIGGFAAMIRLFTANLPAEAADTWVPAIAIISALTMIVGNVVAISQQNIKRMLAYSSIAHAGYILMAVAAAPFDDSAVGASLVYMTAYMFTNLGAFALFIMVEESGQYGSTLEDFKGLAKNNIGLALVLAYFMMSLIGIPLTGGFTGKFLVFMSTIRADLIWLAIVGVLTSAISAFYYLRVIYYMFMFDGEGKVAAELPLRTAVGVSLVFTIFLALVPAPWLDIAREAVMIAGR